MKYWEDTADPDPGEHEFCVDRKPASGGGWRFLSECTCGWKAAVWRDTTEAAHDWWRTAHAIMRNRP